MSRAADRHMTLAQLVFETIVTFSFGFGFGFCFCALAAAAVGALN